MGNAERIARRIASANEDKTPKCEGCGATGDPMDGGHLTEYEGGLLCDECNLAAPSGIVAIGRALMASRIVAIPDGFAERVDGV